MRKWVAGMAACLVALLSVVLLAGAAVAQQDPYDDDGNKPKGEVIEKPEVKGERQATNPEDDQGSILAFTGADVALLVATGVVLVLTGTAVVRRVRSTRVQT